MSRSGGPPSMVARVNALLVAPGADRAELGLGYGTAVIGALTVTVLGLVSGGTPLQVVVLAVVGFDLAGGVVVNATAAAERRFHDVPDWRRRSVLFVAAHVHPFILAALFPAQSWWAAALLYAGLVLSAVLITSSTTLRRPVAFACAAVLVLLASATGPADPALAWVAPLLVIKLLLSHLLDGAAVRPRSPG
ncbi:hypothetical protein MF406_01115 [Georgenia sp. TF02-10]|uniref:hypothetical protein n=1 Tax=Georgenia sp. TF02-10 TaxID=2917725 RepID=UPI001FA6AE65|nr:hypothetical protein [Georgenia sp. TF02-10]UNX54929.1 hypothetical protein MF406_01115 [Georgenia sp. TF02-10]